jgi:hypothetical protein
VFPISWLHVQRIRFGEAGSKLKKKGGKKKDIHFKIYESETTPGVTL